MNKEIINLIQEAAMQVYPPDVDQVGYDGEAMREILSDANQEKRSDLEDGMYDIVNNVCCDLDVIDFAKWVVVNKYILHPYSGKWVFEFDINGRQYEDREIFKMYCDNL